MTNAGRQVEPESAPSSDANKPDRRHRPEHWAQTGVLRRLLKNASLLLSSKGLAALAGVAYLAVAARDLGPHNFGLLILVHAYAIVFRELTSFKSWQAVIRYGTDHVIDADTESFHRLLRLTTMLDIAGALLGVLLAVVALPLIGTRFGFSAELLPFVALYCLGTAFALKSTPTGILRLFDRYGLVARHGLIAPMVRLVGVLAIHFSGLSFYYYLAVWFLADVTSTGVLLWLGWREFGQHEMAYGFRLRGPWRSASHQKIWPFIWNSNLHGTVNLAGSHIPTLMSGLVLGPSAAGVVKIAQEMAGLLSKPAQLLSDTIYPELARLVVAHDSRRTARVIFRASLMGLGFAAVVITLAHFGGEGLILAVLGSGYASTFDLLMLLIIAAGIQMTCFPMDPMMFALGRPGVSFRIKLFTSLVQVVSMYYLLSHLGVTGAGVAMILGTALSGVLLFAATLYQFRAK